MNKTETEEGSNEDVIDNKNCRLCGLQTFEMLFDKSADSTNKMENCPCFIKEVIAYLHEQILSCKENDKTTKPKVALSSDNKSFNSQKLKNLQKQYKIFTDQAVYHILPLAEFKPIKTVNLVCIETMTELKIMLSKLLKCNEIAVNLEYYSLRSYLGFTWLLQISTTQTNYFVNCLRLENELHILNKVFMNINILKIFYKGQDSILRMQKDFGIFVRNMFDIDVVEKSLQAFREIELAKNNVFSFVDPKHTYLLLYMKMYITNLLLQLYKTDILKSVRKQCNKMCNRIYSKLEWNDESVLQNFGSTKASSQEIYIIKQLLIWRDETAKKEDVASNLILPDNKILECAKEFLNNTYSETFNKYCNIEFVKNGKVELNTNEIIKAAKKHCSSKQRCIANCLRSNVDLNVSQKIKSQHPIRTSTYVHYENISDKSIVIEDSNNSKVLRKEVDQQTKYLQIKIDRTEQTRRWLLLTVLKPQLRFQEIIDNSSKIWKPTIKEKPNGLVPLQIVKKGSMSRYCHPYQTELQHFSIPQSQLVEKTVIPLRKIEETTLYVIKTPKDLVSLASELENYNEIAIDLKYNRERSYLGYTSIMSISTRNSDYIIDALLLRSSLPILNNVFTNPKILKVFHNSADKLLWLQKDFTLYIVNMFDVARTESIFNRRIRSLKYLKHNVCHIKYKELFNIELSRTEKDWRLRNLSFRVKRYLRHETHYLLHIKDILSNQLSQTGNLLKRYYDYCTNLCKTVYQKPSFNPNCYKDILIKHNIEKKYAGQIIRIKVLKELNRLRHIIAQQEDENPNYILSDKVLLKLVDLLAHDQQQILNLWDYDKKRIYVSKVSSIIWSAKKFKVKTETDDDYHYVYESENDLNEMMEYVSNEKHTTYNKKRSIVTLGDFICYDKANETVTNNLVYRKTTISKRAKLNDVSNRSFTLIKGNRWDETRNIDDWLRKWIGKSSWSGKFDLRKVNDDHIFIITLGCKKYKDIIWNKRNQIHYEEGVLINNILSHKNRQKQRVLCNIAKDLRNNGVQVQLRELTLKIEDKWYEWRLDSLQEISEETVRRRGVDTDL